MGYVALIVAGGAASLWASGWPSPPPGLTALVFWVLANTLCEILWLPAPEGKGYLSMATAANFATLLVLPPGVAIAMTALAGGLADTIFRRRRWYQVLFNMGMTSISVAVAAQVFVALGGASGSADEILSPLNALPLLLAGVTFFLANTWLVAGVVAISQGRSFPEVWRTQFAFNVALLGALVLLVLGYFFAILFLTWGYLSAFLAAAAAYFVRDAYGRFIREMSEPRPGLGPVP